MYIPNWVILLTVAVLVVVALALFRDVEDVKEKLEELQSSVDDLKEDESEEDEY